MDKLVAVEILEREGRVWVRAFVARAKNRRLVWEFDRTDMTPEEVKTKVAEKEVSRSNLGIPQGGLA